MKLRIPGFRSHATLCASLLAAALFSGGVARAQKFAIINMNQAMLATSDGKKASAEIDAKFGPLKTQLDQLQKDIAAKQDAYTKGRSTMNVTAASAAQAEIERMTTELTRRKEDAQQDLQDEENKLFGAIAPKLEQIINTFAAANQITFVVDTSANPNNLIYADGSLNIITPVVAAYEKAAGLPAPAATSAPKPPAAARPPATVPRATAPAK